jgi:hypothetical protein
VLELFFFFLSAFLILHPSSFEEGARLLRFMRCGSLSLSLSLLSLSVSFPGLYDRTLPSEKTCATVQCINLCQSTDLAVLRFVVLPGFSASGETARMNAKALFAPDAVVWY